jgi:serine/threonine protein kinase
MIGTTISHYRALQKLGGGGMGVVYKAEDMRLGRTVAIKLLPQALVNDATALERFRREARAASALNHPNIVTVYEIGEDATGAFLVMEWIQGETLRSRMKRSLDLATLIDCGIQVARALKTAHQASIVHRDIKPDNIMVRSDGYVKLVDFGLARVHINPEGETVTSGLTKEGTWLGPSSTVLPNRRERSLWNAVQTFSHWGLSSMKPQPGCTHTMVVRRSVPRSESFRTTRFLRHELIREYRQHWNGCCSQCCRRTRGFVPRLWRLSRYWKAYVCQPRTAIRSF